MICTCACGFKTEDENEYKEHRKKCHRIWTDYSQRKKFSNSLEGFV